VVESGAQCLVAAPVNRRADCPVQRVRDAPLSARAQRCRAPSCLPAASNPVAA
jgi:hypothetical protein